MSNYQPPAPCALIKRSDESCSLEFGAASARHEMGEVHLSFELCEVIRDRFNAHEELLKLVMDASYPGGLSEDMFAKWLVRARAAIAKATQP